MRGAEVQQRQGGERGARGGGGHRAKNALPLSLTFARLGHDGLGFRLGGQQALDAVLAGGDLHGVFWCAGCFGRRESGQKERACVCREAPLVSLFRHPPATCSGALLPSIPPSLPPLLSLSLSLSLSPRQSVHGVRPGQAARAAWRGLSRMLHTKRQARRCAGPRPSTPAPTPCPPPTPSPGAEGLATFDPPPSAGGQPVVPHSARGAGLRVERGEAPRRPGPPGPK